MTSRASPCLASPCLRFRALSGRVVPRLAAPALPIAALRGVVAITRESAACATPALQGRALSVPSSPCHACRAKPLHTWACLGSPALRSLSAPCLSAHSLACDSSPSLATPRSRHAAPASPIRFAPCPDRSGLVSPAFPRPACAGLVAPRLACVSTPSRATPCPDMPALPNQAWPRPAAAGLATPESFTRRFGTAPSPYRCCPSSRVGPRRLRLASRHARSSSPRPSQ